MADFVRVASVKDLPDPGKLAIELDDRVLVLVRVNGLFYCIDDVCTHDGGPLGEGSLCGFEIACPRHGAKFDVRNGHAVAMPATKPTGSYEVEIAGDDVLVKLGE